MSREITDRAGLAPRTGVTGAVLVAHGGQSVSTRPASPAQLAVLRMIPVARVIRQALRGTGVVVCRPRYRLRGWNDEQASPVPDLRAALDQIMAQFGDIPVVLVGHSMGARAAMRVAGHPAVTAVAGLAPWLPPGEPVAQLAGRRILLAHGTSDRITRPADTWLYAEQARLVTDVTVLEVRGGDHAMLRRAQLWHRIAGDFCRGSFGMATGTETVAGASRQAAGDQQRTVLLRPGCYDRALTVGLLSPGGVAGLALLSPAAAEQVGAAGIHLPGIAGAFQAGLHRQAGRLHRLGHVGRLEEAEVQVDLVPPPLGEVPDPGTDVKRHQGQAAQPEHTVNLGAGAGHLARAEVDDRVECHDGGELTVPGRQREQIAGTEFGLGVLPTGHRDHAIRQVDAHRGRTVAGQPAGHVPGPAAEVGHRRAGPGRFDEGTEQGPVERLVRQFTAESAGVLFGHGVVAAAGRVVPPGWPPGFVHGRQRATDRDAGGKRFTSPREPCEGGAVTDPSEP